MFGIQHRMRFFLCTGRGYSHARSLPQWGEVGGGSQPAAGLLKIFIQILHHQVNRPALGIAHEASERVLAHLKRKRGVVVVVERTERLVAHHPQSEPLRDPLYRKVAKLLQFKLIH